MSHYKYADCVHDSAARPTVLLRDAFEHLTRLSGADRLGQLKNLERTDESAPPHERS